MFKSIGAPELIIILVIVVILFGATKLPAIAKGLGESIRIFKKEVKTDDKKEDAKKDDEKSDK
ncbi:MAG: twin-arginine translocase TatA/TatE family subunit [Micrococcales bacterium]